MAEHAASGADRIERIVLAGASLPSQPVELEHPLLMADEESSETGAERASALDREGTPAGSVLIGKTKHAFIPLAICDRGRLEHDSAASHVDDRKRVRVAVRVNADHVVRLVCKHPH